jgi:hypothetical protein
MKLPSFVMTRVHIESKIIFSIVCGHKHMRMTFTVCLAAATQDSCAWRLPAWFSTMTRDWESFWKFGRCLTIKPKTPPCLTSSNLWLSYFFVHQLGQAQSFEIIRSSYTSLWQERQIKKNRDEHRYWITYPFKWGLIRLTSNGSSLLREIHSDLECDELH